MAKKPERNPFDEQSTNTYKKESKIKNPKFDIKAFKALPIEEQVKIAKEQMASEGGFAHPDILDIYNKEVLKEETLTGKTKKYTKPKKPKSSSAVEKTNKPSTEIKDLSQLSETINQFPEATAQIESSEIPKIQAQVTIIEEGINQNTENALNKAEALGGEEGKQTMQDSLNGVEEEKVEIITTAKEELEEVIRNDETVKPLEIIDQGHAKKNEIENNMNALRNEINDIDKMISKIEENSQGILTDETKAKLTEGFELKGGMQNKLSKLKNELNALNENPSVAGESSPVEQPTNAELMNKMTELTALQASLAGQIASTEKTLAEKDAEILNIEEENLSSEEWNDFLDNNIVNRNILINISNKIKKGDSLSKQEQAIYGANTAEVEKILKENKGEGNIENIEAGNELVLSNLENTQKKGVKEWITNKSESLKNAYGKSMEWLNKDESELTSKERLTRKMLNAGIIGASIFGIGEISGLNNPAVNNANKVWIRSAAAGLMSSITTWNVTQKAIDKIKGDWKSASTWTKAGVVVTGVGVGAGLAVSFLGASTLAITGAAIATKLGSNKAFDKWASNVENQKKELDINALAKSLKEIEEEKAKIDKKLKQIRVYKNLTAGAISIASGLGSMVANQIEFKLRGDTQNININKQDIAKVEVNKEVNLGDNKVEESIKKPFLSNLWNQVKNLRSSNEAAALTAVAKTGGLPQEITPNAEVVDTNNTGNAREILDKKSGITLKENTMVQENTKVNIIPLNKDGTPDISSEPAPEKIVLEKDNLLSEVPKASLVDENAIIDGKDRVGITYAFRDQIKANPELLKSLKSLNIDETRLDDTKYMAQVTKDIAIKTGYMDTEGREIRINKENIGKIAYVLGVDAEGKIEVKEVDMNGNTLETHHEGDSFEGKAKDSYETLKEKASKVSGIVSPERISTDPTYITDDGVEFADLNNNGISDYIERPDGEITPDSLSDDEIEAPEKIIKIEDTKLYTYDNIKDSKNWSYLKDTQVREIFRKGEINMTGEESKISKSLLAFEKDILNKIDNKEEFEKFIRENKTMTLRETVLFYNRVNLAGDFTDELKDEYEYYDKVPQISENSNSNLAQMERIARDEFRKYFRTENELKSITDTYTKNINKLTYGASNQWLEVKDQGALKYMKNNDNYLSSYLKTLQNETGLKPKSNLFRKEEIEEYIMRATMKAKILGRSEYIIPHTVVKEDYNDGMTPAKSGAPSGKPDAIYQQYLEDINK